MYVCMYVIILNRFFGGIWAFLEAKTEKEYGYPIFHLFHFGDQQIDIFYVVKLNTKKWWCAGGRGGGVACRGFTCFTARLQMSSHFALVSRYWAVFRWFFTPSPPIPLVLVCGKYLRIHCFFSVTVPGGCRSQGCHGYPTRSARRD